MPLNRFFKHHTIKGKDVYVVDDHHKALAAWVLVRREGPVAPNLITIDHHTDTKEAFRVHAYRETYKGHVKDTEVYRAGLVTQIDWRCDKSIAKAIANLRHDEHIDAATCSNTINNAFCIQLSDSRATPSVIPAGNRIYPLTFECFIGCQSMPHNDDCRIRQSNEIIESRYLDEQISRGAMISRCFGLPNPESAPYILDVDLDTFHTRRAINPDDPSTFYRLVRNAVAITIATEAECVAEEWLDDEDPMTSDELLKRLFCHINNALV